MAIQTHGAGTYFSLEDSGAATLRNVSIYLTSVDFNWKNDTHDNTTFTATGHGYQVGLTDGTITLSGFWNITASTGLSTVVDSLMALKTTTLGFEYGPDTNTAGKTKYSGECVLQDLAYSSPVADMVTATITLQISGAVTKGTF